MIADGLGRAIAFRIAPGQAHELPHAIPLLDSPPGVPLWMMADCGYTSHAFHEHIRSLGSKPAIPSKPNEAQVVCPDWIYNNRNVVERLWARLKEWRAVATRYEKTASSFMAYSVPPPPSTDSSSNRPGAGFGAVNAPIRLATQTSLAPHPAAQQI